MMIKISKGREPLAWSALKATPGFTEYSSIPELRAALLAEQGYICAYCMRRIPANDPGVDATSKIEHIKSREERNDLQLDYNNMVICCPGNMDNDPHCDKLKGARSVTFDLFSDSLQNSVSYNSKDGAIRCDNEIWNNEINHFLNLNHVKSKLNRKNTLDGVVAAIKSAGWTRNILIQQSRQWSSMNNKGEHQPYCGIVALYLKKKLQQIQNKKP